MGKIGKIKSTKSKPRQIAVLLHDIRSIHNVGSIFRTANALGASKIYLSGFTPTPVDRFGMPRGDFTKVSLGAECALEWKYFEDPIEAMGDFKKAFSGARAKPVVVAIEQDVKSIPYKKVKIPKGQPILFIVGNEVSGIPAKLIDSADIIAEIPQFGTKESLNVAVAFGIVGFGVV